ncbi:MAG: acetyltransferase [Clostridia bacterium]|nr:acetyltransferase [Clostridia bacterium]
MSNQNKLIIVGAGGHGKVIADTAIKNGYTNISFVDDHAVGESMGFPIIGAVPEIEMLKDDQTDFVIGIGNNQTRKAIAERYDVRWVTLIHPSAQIATSVTLGQGTVVMAGAVINACATIGDHCIINTGAVVEHDNVIENYVHISPKAALGGSVCIGEQTHVGIGATVINHMAICGGCTIGAGAVVVKSIEQSGTYIGVPAQRKI